jgi:LacI family transcriptional regulator
VLIDRQVAGISANFVGVDDEKVGFLATRHLIDSGYQRIAHIHGPELSPGRQRFEGYRRALTEAGRPFVPEYIIQSGEKDEEGFEAINRLLTIQPRPDAVFAFNDAVAISALKAVFQAGLRVPQDIALIGAGNFRHADLLRVPLSTVDQANTAIGEQAAKLVLKVIESKTKTAPKSILLDPALVIRESSKPSA